MTESRPTPEDDNDEQVGEDSDVLLEAEVGDLEALPVDDMDAAMMTADDDLDDEGEDGTAVDDDDAATD